MALTSWTGGFGGDPFFDTLDRAIDRAINRSFGFAPTRGGMFGDMMPSVGAGQLTTAAPTAWVSMAGTHPMDVVETDKAFEITADAPGFSPDEINVEVHDGNITIRGEKKEEKEEKDETGRVWRSERMYRRFHRTFRLPENVKEDHIDANLDKGVLKVMVPKMEEAQKPQPKRISVKHGAEGMQKVTAGVEGGAAKHHGKHAAGGAGAAMGQGAAKTGGQQPME